jgi:HSP20 family molecular chaperone IbpA
VLIGGCGYEKQLRLFPFYRSGVGFDRVFDLLENAPGVSRDRVEVRVENDALFIEGRIDFAAYEGLRPVYTEYNIGNYTRTFQLSSKIGQEGISAALKDGFMLVLPKGEKAKPRRIAVS